MENFSGDCLPARATCNRNQMVGAGSSVVMVLSEQTATDATALEKAGVGGRALHMPCVGGSALLNAGL